MQRTEIKIQDSQSEKNAAQAKKIDVINLSLQKKTKKTLLKAPKQKVKNHQAPWWGRRSCKKRGGGKQYVIECKRVAHP